MLFLRSYKKRIFFSIFSLFLFISCESDFSPNAEWEETMLVYGVLNNDADTTWIRIQKCFLGDGNLLEFAKVKDSNHYKENELKVVINEYLYSTAGNQRVKGDFTGNQFPCQRIVLNGKEGGVFSSSEQPVFFSVTKDALRHDRMYELEVKNTATGEFVSATTVPIEDGIMVKSHRDSGSFSFEKKIGGDRSTELKWQTVRSGHSYQPIYRFYFKEKESNTEKYIEYTGAIQRTSGTSGMLSYNMYQSSFLGFIKNNLQKYPKGSLEFVNKLTFQISAANQELTDYMNLNNSETGGSQEKPVYTNIENGIGIYGSRRVSPEIMVKYRTSTQAEIIDSLSYWFY